VRSSLVKSERTAKVLLRSLLVKSEGARIQRHPTKLLYESFYKKATRFLRKRRGVAFAKEGCKKRGRRAKEEEQPGVSKKTEK
jgi:hypothetical protein